MQPEIPRMSLIEMQAATMAMLLVLGEMYGPAVASKLSVYAESFLDTLAADDDGVSEADPNQPSIFDHLDEEAIVEELRERNG